MLGFNITKYSKLKHLIESGEALYTDKIPNYINEKNLKKYNSMQTKRYMSSDIFSYTQSDYELMVVHEEEGEIFYKVHYFLNDKGYIREDMIIPIIDPKNKKVLAFLHRPPSILKSLESPLRFQHGGKNISILEHITDLSNFFEYMNLNGFEIKQINYGALCNIIENFKYCSLRFLQNEYLSLGFTKNEEGSINFNDQARLFALSIYRYLNESSYSLPFLMSLETLEYLRKVAKSDINVDYNELLHKLSMYEKEKNAFSECSVEKYKNIEESIKNLTPTETNLGKCFYLPKNEYDVSTTIVMFSDKKSQEYIREYLEKVLKNFILKNYLKAIIIDENLDIIGYLAHYYDGHDLFSKDTSYYISRVRALTNILLDIVDSDEEYTLDISRLTLENFFISGGTITLKVYDDIFIRKNDDVSKFEAEAIKIIFEYLLVHKTIINSFPPFVKDLFYKYLASKAEKCDFYAIIAKKENVLGSIQRCLMRFNSYGYYDEYIYSPQKLTAMFKEPSYKIEEKGYRYYKVSSQSEAQKIVAKYLECVRLFNRFDILAIVYKPVDDFALEAEGFIIKPIDEKRLIKIKDISTLNDKNHLAKFYTGNVGIFEIYYHYLALLYTDKVTYRTYVPSGLCYDSVNKEFVEADLDADEKILITSVFEEVRKIAARHAEELDGKQIEGYRELNSYLNHSSSLEEKYGVVRAFYKHYKDKEIKFCDKHDFYYKEFKCPICYKKTVFVDNIYEEDQQFELEYGKKVIFNTPLERERFLFLSDMKPYDTYILKFFMPDRYIISPKNDANKVIGYTYAHNSFYKESGVNSLKNISNKKRLLFIYSFLDLVESFCKEDYIELKIDFSMVNNIFESFLFGVDVNNVPFVKLKDYSILKKEISYKELDNFIIEKIAKILEYDEYVEDKYEEAKRLYSLRLDKILDEINKLTNHCAIHNYYYADEKCPLCAKDNVSYEVFDLSNSSLTESGNGGEAKIYENPHDKNLVNKVWKKDKIVINQKYNVVKRIIGKNISEIPYANYKVKIVKPKTFLKITYDTSEEGIIGGYTMDKVNDAKPLRILEEKAMLEKYNFGLSDILEILVNVGKALEYIHSQNMYVGDLSSNNILFDENKWIYILDVDSFGVDEYQSNTYTLSFADPEAIIDEKNIKTSKISDYYSFAIIAFLLITRMHPFKGILYENGNKVRMKTEDRMKNKISVLGSHVIILPAHIQKEDFETMMSDDLRKAFFEIFEEGKRFSITSKLEDEFLASIKLKEPLPELPKETLEIEFFKDAYDTNAETKTLDGFDENLASTINNNEIISINVKHESLNLSYILSGKNLPDMKLGNLRYKKNLFTLAEKSDEYQSQISYLNEEEKSGESKALNAMYIKYSAFSNYKSVKADIANVNIIAFDHSFNFRRILIMYVEEDRLKLKLYKEKNKNSYIVFTSDLEEKYSDKKDGYNVLYDEVEKQFFVFADDRAYICRETENSKSLNLSLIEEKFISTIPRESFNLKNYYFYANSLYVPMKNGIFSKNLINGSEKSFKVNNGLIPKEVIWLIKTGNGFDVYSYDTKHNMWNITHILPPT